MQQALWNVWDVGEDIGEPGEWIAGQIDAGRVSINAAPHAPLAPFGGSKQSGICREFGAFGLDAFLEPRAIIA